MRLALLTDDWSPTGGVSSYLRRLAPALVRAGHKVLVLHAGDDAPDLDGQPGIDVRGVRGAFRDFGRHANTRVIPDVVSRLADFQPDLVHFHQCANLELQGEVRDRYPVIKTLHALETCPAGTRYHAATQRYCSVTTGPMCLPRQVYLRCTLSKRPQVIWRQYRAARQGNALYQTFPRIIVASEFVRLVAIGDGFDPAHVTVVPYFTNHEPHTAAAAGRTVLFVGRLVYEKGVDLLLDAMSRVEGHWRLVIVGDGMRMAALRSLVETRGWNDRVQFRGWLNGEALADAYRAADVVAVPSRWPEPFGIVGLEALSHGRPVVAFGVGGIPEWLAEGVGGHVVAPLDAAAMAGRIGGLLDDPEEAEATAARGRQRVREEFNEATHVAQLTTVYERLLAAHR